MFHSLPPLSALRAFEATARLGSVSLAARELGRTHGAVSRQISALQDHAGVALFDRKGAGLTLNAQGEAFHRVVAESLGAIERGYRRLRDDARGPGVHVACSATFAMRWLVPRLGEFYRRNPGVAVRLSMTGLRAIRDEGADLVLTWDRLSFPIRESERAIPLADVEFGPVCQPGSLVSLAGERLMLDSRIVHEHTRQAWTNWEALSGLSAVSKSEIAFPHTHLCIEAAAAGLGAALVERRLVKEELVAGRLIAPCGWVRFAGGFAALPSAERPAGPPARAFLDWLTEALGAEA